MFGEIVRGRVQLSVAGEAVRRCWVQLPAHVDVRLDAFVVMPNHVHGIVWLDNARRDHGGLGRAIGLFKASSARLINTVSMTPGRSVWQRGYHDRVVRDETELRALRQYIVENPMRWDLDRENVGRAAAP